MDQTELEANIFWPGVYHGSTDSDYTKLARELPVDEVIELVQKRAEADGQWAIDNNLVGPNENKMRVMMAFVHDPEMIAQAIHHPSNAEETVDFICRDLANASKVVANS